MVGADAQIFLDAFPEDAYRGKVLRIWPTANRQKATVEVRVGGLCLYERAGQGVVHWNAPAPSPTSRRTNQSTPRSGGSAASSLSLSS